jgi:hypothetical protein
MDFMIFSHVLLPAQFLLSLISWKLIWLLSSYVLSAILFFSSMFCKPTNQRKAINTMETAFHSEMLII